MDYAYDNDVTIIASNSDLDSFHHNYPNTSQHAISVHAIRYDSGTLGYGDDVLQLQHLHQLRRAAHAVDSGHELLVGGGRPLGRIGGAALLGGAASGAACRRQSGHAPPDGRGSAPAAHRHRRQLLRSGRRHRSDQVSDDGAAAERARLRASLRLRPAQRAQRRRRHLRRTAAARGRHPLAGLVRHDLSGQDAVGDHHDALRLARRRAARGHDDGLGDRVGARRRSDRRQVHDHRARRDVDDGRRHRAALGRLVADREQSGAAAERSDVRSPTIRRTSTSSRCARAPCCTRRTRRSTGVKGESRHAVSIYKDPDLVAGFPMFLGDSGEGSPKIADLVGDGKREIVFADTGGKVHAITRRRQRARRAGRSKTETLPFLDAAHGNHANAPAILRARSIPRATPRRARPRPSATSTATASPRSWSPPGSAACGPGTATAASSAAFRCSSIATPFPSPRTPITSCRTASSPRRRSSISTETRSSRSSPPAWTASSTPGTATAARRTASPSSSHDTDADARAAAAHHGLAGRRRSQRRRHARHRRRHQRGLLERRPRLRRRRRDRRLPARLAAAAWCRTTSCPSSARACRARRRWPTSTATACPRCSSPASARCCTCSTRTGKPFGPALVNQKEKYGAKSNARNPIEFMMVASPSVGDLDNDGTPDLVEGGAGSDALLGIRHRRAAPRLRASRRRVGRQDRQVQERLSAGHRGLAVLLASGDRRRRRRRQAGGASRRRPATSCTPGTSTAWSRRASPSTRAAGRCRRRRSATSTATASSSWCR